MPPMEMALSGIGFAKAAIKRKKIGLFRNNFIAKWKDSSFFFLKKHRCAVYKTQLLTHSRN